MKKDFTELFCFVDDFVKSFEDMRPKISGTGFKPGVANYLNASEIATILIGFYQSSFDCFKHYYQEVILEYHDGDFKLVSYSHFTRLICKILPFLTVILNGSFDKCDGLSFVDSTSIAVCKNYRIYSHRVFKGLAARGKSTKGWFYGFKLHLIINLEGGLLKASFSSGNKDDRKHFADMTKDIFGKVFGDRGYISKSLWEELWSKGIQLVTRVKKNMKNILMPLADKLKLLQRALVETVIGKIKFLDKFEHSRHRSPTNAFSHMLACLINYQLLKDKPSIKSLLQLDGDIMTN